MAKELGISNPDTINELLDGEKIEDYSDVDKIYEEQERAMKDIYSKNEEDIDE